MNRVEKVQKKKGAKAPPFKLDRGYLLYFYHPDILQAVVGLGHYHICDCRPPSGEDTATEIPSDVMYATQSW